jgi:hypothetical protein
MKKILKASLYAVLFTIACTIFALTLVWIGHSHPLILLSVIFGGFAISLATSIYQELD